MWPLSVVTLNNPDFQLDSSAETVDEVISQKTLNDSPQVLMLKATQLLWKSSFDLFLLIEYVTRQAVKEEVAEDCLYCTNPSTLETTQIKNSSSFLIDLSPSFFLSTLTDQT